MFVPVQPEQTKTYLLCALGVSAVKILFWTSMIRHNAFERPPVLVAELVTIRLRSPKGGRTLPHRMRRYEEGYIGANRNYFAGSWQSLFAFAPTPPPTRLKYFSSAEVEGRKRL